MVSDLSLEPLLDLATVAKIFLVSKTTIRRWAAGGKLRAVRVGREPRSRRADIQFQTPFVLEMQRRLIVAIKDFNAESSRQTGEVIKLTRKLETLTIVVTWLTGTAVLFGGIQASAILVHLFRWLKGW